MTEQYQQPSINLADTILGVPLFEASEFDAVNPVGLTDTTGARFLNPTARSGMEYILPPAGEPTGDAGQIIFTRPGIYQSTITVGLSGGASAVGITWIQPGGVRPLLTTDPTAGIFSPPSDFESLRSYGFTQLDPVIVCSGLLFITPLFTTLPFTAYVNITPSAASSAVPTYTSIQIARISPLGS